MSPGETITIIRVELDLSLREVAREAGISSVRLGEIERGVVGPGLFTEEVKAKIYAAMAKLVKPRGEKRAAEFTSKLREAGL